MLLLNCLVAVFPFIHLSAVALVAFASYKSSKAVEGCGDDAAASASAPGPPGDEEVSSEAGAASLR
eukprot:646138-Rhodomonas_salina.1